MVDNNITIVIRNLSIGYVQRQKRVLSTDINLEARRGEIVALIGPNGIGKSTLLKTIIRFQKALTGEIYIKHKLLNTFHREEFARLVSFVSTEPLRLANVSVYELVALGRFPYTNWLGTLTANDSDVVSKAISSVGIDYVSEKSIHEISDSERQRTLIARALAQDTEIIILDEPTAFLDLPNKYELVHMLAKLAHVNNKTIVFSTHDLNIAIAEVDKIWLMHNQKIYEGAPEDLILGQVFSDIFDNRLIFDIQTGDFKSSRKFSNNIFLHACEGIEYYWTLKALDRIGYKVNAEKPGELILELEKRDSVVRWKLNHKGTVQLFDNIYALILFLKNMHKQV
jgi:iron complex transport system ATP-binding protein